MATITQLTVSYGETRSKDFQSRKHDLSITLALDEGESWQDAEALWTDKLKAGVKKALAIAPPP